MKYYMHDSNSFQDEKITELFINYGYEGLGLFYTLLEKFALQEKPIKTAVLKRQLSVGKKLEKCWKFMESLELIYSNNGETFNENILKFTEKFQKSQEKNKKRLSQWRENKSLTENVTRSEHVRNADNLTILNLTELKEIEKRDLTPVLSKVTDNQKQQFNIVKTECQTAKIWQDSVRQTVGVSETIFSAMLKDYFDEQNAKEEWFRDLKATKSHIVLWMKLRRTRPEYAEKEIKTHILPKSTYATR